MAAAATSQPTPGGRKDPRYHGDGYVEPSVHEDLFDMGLTRRRSSEDDIHVEGGTQRWSSANRAPGPDRGPEDVRAVPIPA